MLSRFLRGPARFILALAILASPSVAKGQSFGVELNNTLMPASGGMAGVSIAQPQDLTSSLNGNPATLTQFRGTQFIFGGAWAEPTFNLTQTSNIPVVGPALLQPFSAKSTAPGIPGGNIGVTQDLSELGLPATFGIGFVSTAGGFVDFRQVPESRGTNSGMAIFSAPLSFGVDVTERLSVGATTALGIAFFDGPFVGTSGMTPGYGLRGTLGANYRLTDFTTVGGYYQTQQHFKFDNAFILAPGPNQISQDVRMDLPQNIGFGAANNAMMEGNLLIAVDVLYKLWDQADLFKAVYNNQWVVQIGSQYSLGRYRLRAGYAWAQNPLDPNPGPNIGGVVQPGGLPAVRYTQGLLAIANQHRLSGGIGIVDVLPGVNFDMFAGGMFRDTQHLGDFTTTSAASYWVGFGLTWQFGRGSCCSTGAPDSWCSGS
jgi:long-chain fatty acid transport protein